MTLPINLDVVVSANNPAFGGCGNLGELYYVGTDVAQNYQKARELYEKACRFEDGAGCGSLGNMYALGRGVRQSYPKAFELFEKACALKDGSWCNNLGYRYSRGIGVRENGRKARAFFEKACDLDDGSGCTNLGLRYARGIDVRKDSARAVELFEKACSLESAGGCNSLGLMHDKGEGVRQDYAKSRAFFEKACALESGEGCNNLGVMYVNGEGVREGTSMTFTAPADILDAAGTTKLVCLGTSRYPDRGRSFTLVVTEDIVFEWDLWQTNYLVSVSQTTGGSIKRNGSTAADFWATAGSTVDLAATPDSDKTLFRWNVESGSPGGLAPPDAANAAGTPLETLSLCVDRPLAVSAVFGVFDDMLAEALDAPALTFTTGGDADWAPAVDAKAQSGYTSARSGAGGRDTDTWLDLSLEGAGTLSFRWRTDCEKDDGGGATWDRLAVFVNGVEFSRIDGTTDWQMVTIPVSGPKTTIRWSFYRDDWDDPDPPRENAGWIDGVTFTTEGL